MNTKENSITIGNSEFELIFNHTNPDISSPHIHSFYELFYINEGTTSITVENINLLLRQNDMLLLTPNTYHNLDFTNSSQYFTIAFAFNKLKSKNSMRDYYAEFSNIFNSDGYILAENAIKVGQSLQNFFFACKNDNFAKEYRIYSAFNSLILSIYDTLININAVRIAKNISTENPVFRYDIDQYFYENYYKDITLETLSNKLCLSPKSTSRIIKSTYNQTFSQVKNRFRIENAKKLLRKTDFPIEKIAAEVGYLSIRNFFTVFSKFENCTPSEYRNKFKNHNS